MKALPCHSTLYECAVENSLPRKKTPDVKADFRGENAKENIHMYGCCTYTACRSLCAVQWLQQARPGRMQARTYIQSFLAVCARKRGNEWQAGPPDVCVCVFSASYLNHVYVASKYVRPSECRGEKTTLSPFLGNTCHQMCDEYWLQWDPTVTTPEPKRFRFE